jgi:DNA transformation protein and related proteins
VKLSTLKNIGPVTERWLNEVGIHTPDDLERVGVLEAYRQVSERHPQAASLLLLYALQGALWNTQWNQIPREEKARLKAEAERL